MVWAKGRRYEDWTLIIIMNGKSTEGDGFMKKVVLFIMIFIGLLICNMNVRAESEDGLRVVNENLDYSFTTTDGTVESTTANGRPKVLIFYMPSCAPCHMLFDDIAKDPTHYTDYDILAIKD